MKSLPASRFLPLLAGGAVALTLAGYLLPPYYAGLAIDCLIFAILASSLNLLLGHAGLPSLGHAAYFGMGAYAAGLVAVHVGTSFWLGALAGVAAAATLGAAFGAVALRTSGVYFLMITVALGQIAWAVAFSWRRVTGGDDGLRGIRRPDLGVPGLSLDDRNAYFVLAAACCLLTVAFLWSLYRSPFGRVLRGIQENPTRMGALGYEAWLYRYLAFILSSAIAGLAGVLFAYNKGFVSPEAVSIVISAEVMLMVIIGGSGTLFGPLIGAAVIVAISHIVSGFTDRWHLVLGSLYVLVVLLAPKGIVGAVRSLATRRGEPGAAR